MEFSRRSMIQSLAGGGLLLPGLVPGDRCRFAAGKNGALGPLGGAIAIVSS